MDGDRTILQFSLDRSLTLGFFQTVVSAGSLILAFDYLFHFISWPHSIRYSAWSDLFNSAGGWTGFLFWAAFGGWVAPWAFRSIWRVVDRRPAMIMEPDGLRLHPSLFAGPFISFEDIGPATLRDESGPSFFGLIKPIVRLRIAAGHGKIWVRSNEVLGGRQALEDFLAELDARRTFGGEVAQG